MPGRCRPAATWECDSTQMNLRAVGYVIMLTWRFNNSESTYHSLNPRRPSSGMASSAKQIRPRYLVRRRDALSQAVSVMISSGIDEWVSRSSCLMCMVGPQVCHDKHFRTRCCCHLWSRPPRPGWCRNVRTCMRTRHIFDTALCSPSNSTLPIKNTC